MDCSEKVLCGTGEVDLDPNIVSEEAGKLYSELQVRPLSFSVLILINKNKNSFHLAKHPGSSLKTVIETHGEGVVESLVPIFVWVLEGLASCKAQLREKEDEAEQEKGEREELLERYQAEKALRKESQEVRNDGRFWFDVVLYRLFSVV